MIDEKYSYRRATVVRIVIALALVPLSGLVVVPDVPAENVQTLPVLVEAGEVVQVGWQGRGCVVNLEPIP